MNLHRHARTAAAAAVLLFGAARAAAQTTAQDPSPFLDAAPQEAQENQALQMAAMQSFLDRDYNAALGLFTQLAEKSPSPAMRSAWQYKRGLCLLLTGQVDASRAVFRDLGNRDAGTESAFKARHMLSRIDGLAALDDAPRRIWLDSEAARETGNWDEAIGKLDAIDPKQIEEPALRDSLRAENAKMKLTVMISQGAREEAGELLAETLPGIGDRATAFGVLSAFVEASNNHISGSDLSKNIREIERLGRFLDAQSDRFLKDNPDLEIQCLVHKCQMQSNILQMANIDAGGDPNRAAQSAKDALELYSELYGMLDTASPAHAPVLMENLDDYLKVLLLNGRIRKAETLLANMLQTHSDMQALAKPMLTFVTVNRNWGNADRARDWLNYMLVYFPDAVETRLANEQFGDLLLRAQDKGYADEVSDSLSGLAAAGAADPGSPQNGGPTQAASGPDTAARDANPETAASRRLILAVAVAGAAVALLVSAAIVALRVKKRENVVSE